MNISLRLEKSNIASFSNKPPKHRDKIPLQTSWDLEVTKKMPDWNTGSFSPAPVKLVQTWRFKWLFMSSENSVALNF